MTRKIYVWRDGKFIERTSREVNPTTQIITDTMQETWHPCDGRKYDSKSAFRRVTRAHGGVEVGNDRVDTGPRQDSSSSVKADLIEAAKKTGFI